MLSPGLPWTWWPGPTDREGTAELHHTTVDTVFATWADAGSIAPALVARVGPLSAHTQLDLHSLHGAGTNTVAQTGGAGLGSSGHQHPTGENVIAIMDTNGSVRAPLPVAPVHDAETVVWPEGWPAEAGGQADGCGAHWRVSQS